MKKDTSKTNVQNKAKERQEKQMTAEVYDVVQFVPEHKWGGCFGFVHEKKEFGDDTRYMIGVPVPEGGTAYIFSMESKNEFEKIGGSAIFVPADPDDE